MEFNKLNEFLQEFGLNDEIYEVLQKEDKGEAVMTAMEILEMTNKMPVIAEDPKMVETSQYFRKLADESLEAKDYKNAFAFYNQALLCAPKDSSDSLLEAYYGRATMLFKKTCFEACLVDIEKCLAWEHPDYQSKLKQMKEVCKKKIKANGSSKWYQVFDNFFSIIGQTHPKVSCVSSAVDFNIENGQAKVVARRNIPIGTIVALEPAFVGHLDKENQARACHFCHALSLNLIPCDGCTYILFCSEKCKKLCWEEYHNVECHIIKVANCSLDIYPLSLRAALKLKKMCTWEEFISLSFDLGLKETKSSLINEVYDVNKKVSILRCNDDRHLVFGQTYNDIFVYATIVHYLEKVPLFFPDDVKEKNEAIRAFSRVLIHLRGTYGHTKTSVYSVAKESDTGDIRHLKESNYGLFSFTSKLSHSCDPNLLVVGLNNKVALLALKSIKSGDELTISYVGHWHDSFYTNRALALFLSSEITCRCPVCLEGWSPFTSKNATMNEQQRASFEKWNRLKCAYVLGMIDLGTYFKETCYCYSAFQNLSNTKEHEEIMVELRRKISFFQYVATKNCSVLDPVKTDPLRQTPT